jgi:MFS family permease
MLDVRPLRSSTFRHLAAGYWVNELGNWIGEIALAILVFDRTRSPLATATLFLALRFLPALLAPLLTVRVEALRPRVTLPCLYVLEGVFFAGLAFLADHFSLPAILCVSALDGMLAITAKALTRGISATWLIRRELLREGNAILNLGAMASMAAGPALGGAAVAWKGGSTALTVDAATFVVTAAIIATAPGLHLETDYEAGFKGRVRAGLDVLRAYAAVRRLLVAVAFVFLLGSIPIPIEVVFAKETLHAGDRGYGFLLGAWGVGMIVGGVGFAAFTEMRLIRLLGVSTVLALLGYAGLAISPTLEVACLFSALGGIGNGAGWIAAVTAVQERIPISTQSAVMSVLEGINQLMPAVGFIVGGAITAATSPRDAYAVSAIGVAVVVVAVAMRPIDRARLSPVVQDPEKLADISECVPEKDRNPSVNAQELMQTARTLPVTDL